MSETPLRDALAKVDQVPAEQIELTKDAVEGEVSKDVLRQYSDHRADHPVDAQAQSERRRFRRR